MRREKFFGRTVYLQGSPLTLLIFQQEFRGDPDAHDGDFAAQVTDIIRSDEHDGKAAFYINYLGFLRIAWALARTYDKKIPNFEAWLEDFPEEAFNLKEGGDELVDAVNRTIEKEIFATERPYKREMQDDDEEEEDILDKKWDVYKYMLILKRAGYSLDEIREMSMYDFIALTDLYAGPDKSKDENENGKVKKATQADIDKLFPV